MSDLHSVCLTLCLLQIMLFQSSLLMGGRLDRFRDWRLDVDNMSYEVIVHKPI